VSDDSNWIAKIIDLAVRQEQFETLAQAGVRLALDGKTTLAEVMRATSDIGYIPSTRRFEQILIHQRILSLDDLELIQREISDLRTEGKIIPLEHHLIARKMCSPEQVAKAMKLSGHRPINS
jgi:general secretion pathway protein E